MNALAAWAIDAMVASTLLMALVLLVRALVRRAFGPQVGYALWLLPLLRLGLPPLPAAWHAARPVPLAHAGETLVLIVAADPAAAAGSASDWPSLGGVVAAIWAAGAVLFLAWHVVAHRRFRRRILATAVPVATIGGVAVVRSDAAPGPIAFGVRRRYVALPADVAERYDDGERALALAHELSHHRRGDLVANWAALGVLALHWFDPVAWRAFRAFRIDQEIANDAAVLAGRSPVDRQACATAILKTACGGALTPACHLHTVADLKGRLKMLATSPISRRRLATGSATLSALVVGALALIASEGGAAAVRAQVADVAPPAPPAAPAPAAAPDHRISKVIVTKDGRTTVHDDLDSAAIDRGLAAGQRIAIAPAVPGGSRMVVKMPDDPAALVEVQDIPAVRQAKCGIGNGRPASMVIQNGKGPKRLIVVCTDRIAKVTADAAATAANARGIEHDAYARALTGLIDARASVTADSSMADADRARALTAIDTSIAEMKVQIAHRD